MDKSRLIQRLYDYRTDAVQKAEHEVSRTNSESAKIMLAIERQKLENILSYLEKLSVPLVRRLSNPCSPKMITGILLSSL